MSVRMKLSLHGANVIGSIYLFVIWLSILLTIDTYCIEEILKDLGNFRDSFRYF